MASIGDNLKRLATAFTVRDIMLNTKDLVCATVESDGALVSSSYPDFSVIPIKAQGKLTSYYCRDSATVSPIALSDLISDGTGLLDLVEILEHRQFAFVLGPRQIDGYVHYSDLNHHLVKLAFYGLLEGVERFTLDSVRPRLSEEFLKTALGLPRFEQVLKFYRRAGDAGQSVINYLNIADVLALAKRAGTVQVDDDVIRAIKCARDGAAHGLENLVSDYEDVKKLAEVKRQCLRILSHHRDEILADNI
jgi:hypothetical protein